MNVLQSYNSISDAATSLSHRLKIHIIAKMHPIIRFPQKKGEKDKRIGENQGRQVKLKRPEPGEFDFVGLSPS